MDIAIYEHLARIRDIDEKILKLQRSKAQTPQEITNLKKKLSEIDSELKTKELKFKEESAKKSNIVGVITTEKDKLAKSETKLPQVKNSKEYQAVMKEIDKAKKTIQQLEEQEKTQSLSTGEAEKIYLKVKSDFDATSKEYEKFLVAYKDKSNSLEMDIKDLQEERAKELSTLPEKVKKQYDILHPKLNGISIANVNAGRCSVCNMMIPPQTVNNLLKCEDIQTCRHCLRILVSLPASK